MTVADAHFIFVTYYLFLSRADDIFGCRRHVT